MYRQIIAIILGISFVAMATSGLMMFFIDEISFNLQMHPVHKPFGLVMVVAAALHIWLNRRSLTKYLKTHSGAVLGAILTVALISLYGIAVNNAIPPETAAKLDAITHEAEVLQENDQ